MTDIDEVPSTKIHSLGGKARVRPHPVGYTPPNPSGWLAMGRQKPERPLIDLTPSDDDRATRLHMEGTVQLPDLPESAPEANRFVVDILKLLQVIPKISITCGDNQSLNIICDTTKKSFRGASGFSVRMPDAETAIREEVVSKLLKYVQAAAKNAECWPETRNSIQSLADQYPSMQSLLLRAAGGIEGRG